jgi:DNA-binding GntR family transcriptional regulator
MAESPLGVFASSLGYKATNDVSLGRIELRTRPGSVAHVLRNAILDGTLPQGSPLRETHLATDLGVSRAPLREALGMLADEGLIVRIPYRGAFVSPRSARGVSRRLPACESGWSPTP